MILIGVAIISLASAWLMEAWRNVEGRILRWKLYAIRDRLRMIMIERKPLAASQVFRRLDRAVSHHCDQLGYLSFWMLLPVMVMSQSRQQAHEMKEFSREMSRPENAEFAACYDDATREILRYLVKRHILVVALVLPTVIGLWLLLRSMRKLASAVASGAIDPVAIDTGRARAAA